MHVSTSSAAFIAFTHLPLARDPIPAPRVILFPLEESNITAVVGLKGVKVSGKDFFGSRGGFRCGLDLQLPLLARRAHSHAVKTPTYVQASYNVLHNPTARR